MRKPISRLAVKLATLSIVDTHYLVARGVITKEVLEDVLQAQDAKRQEPAKLSSRRKDTPKESRRKADERRVASIKARLHGLYPTS